MSNEWQYCPECGCLEFTDTTYSRGRFCDSCGQEWFPDLDYSDVVIKKLTALTTANERIRELEEHVTALVRHWNERIAAEREVSDKLLDALKRSNEFIGYMLDHTPEDKRDNTIFVDNRAALSEVAAIRKGEKQ